MMKNTSSFCVPSAPHKARHFIRPIHVTIPIIYQIHARLCAWVMLQHKPFCKKSVRQTGKNKKMWTHIFKQAMIDSFFPNSNQSCRATNNVDPPSRWRCTERLFKTRAFFSCSLASFWTLGAVGPLGKYCINVAKRLCSKHFHIFI